MERAANINKKLDQEWNNFKKNIIEGEQESMPAKSYWRGHYIVWNNNKWVFTDNLEPVPGYGGKIRPCAECNKIFEGSNVGDADPCLGELPGVDNACCGHGIREQSYIRFTNGIIVKGFKIERKIK